MATADALRAFITILPAELPDKSMFATIVLVARYRRPVWVWVGASGAFALHVAVAAAAGTALSLLPDVIVGIVVVAMFAVGAVMLWRAGRRAAAEEDRSDVVDHATVRSTVAASFALIVLAEWGDLTQVATAGLAARSGAPIATALGAWAALATISALAVSVGRQLVDRVPIHRVNRIGAVVFAALAAWTLVELLR